MRYWVFPIAAIIFSLVGWSALVIVGVVPSQFGSYALNGLIYALYTAVVICVDRLIYLRKVKSDPDLPEPEAFSARWIGTLKSSAPILIAIFLFLPVFSMLKSAIPLFTDYSWDPRFIEWDRAIHGQDAWLAFQPLLGWPIVTAILAVLYHLWMLLPYFGCLSVLYFIKDRALIFRFFAAYFLCWIVLGVIGATWLASVGPCFAAPMLGIHTFDPQMAYLREANEHYPVMVLKVQDALIAWYQSGSSGLGRGISAMPSMHVSIAVLFALVARQISRALFIAATVFAVLIMLGSVHLAYHYAVDGYLAIVAKLAIWALAGWLERATRKWA